MQVSFIPAVYTPGGRFRTSSPGFRSTIGPFPMEELSSVNVPSSIERSFPSTVSSPFIQSLSTSQQTPSSLEMQRSLHDPRFRHQFRPIQRIHGAEVNSLKRISGLASLPGPQTPKRPIMQTSSAEPSVFLYRPQLRIGGNGDSRLWRDGRHIHLPGHDPQPPHHSRVLDAENDYYALRNLEFPRVSAIQKAVMTPRQQAVYQRLQRHEPSFNGWYERPLATSSPPRTDRRVARVPPSPVKTISPPFPAVPKSDAGGATATQPKTVREDRGVSRGSDSSGSDHQPQTYTRDRLIGAVERVRSSGLHHSTKIGQPFRHSAPELAAAVREPAQSSPSPVTTSPRSSPYRPSPGSGSRRRRTSEASRHRYAPSPSTVRSSLQDSQSPAAEADSTYVSDDALRGLDHVRLAPLSGSRSRTSVTSGSSGRGSSGQVSKLSHSRGDSLQGEIEFNSRIDRRLLPHGDDDKTGDVIPITSPKLINGNLQRSSGITHHRSPLDLSVDENYEFDSVSPPLESDLLEKLREYTINESNSTRRPRMPSGERGLSDSELYTGFSLYPRPKRPSKYINTEARCAALKQEFMTRRMQSQEDGSDELESAC